MAPSVKPTKKSSKSASTRKRGNDGTKRVLAKRRIDYASMLRALGTEECQGALARLRAFREKYPNCPRVNQWMSRFAGHHQQAMLSDSTLSDDVTTLTEAPFDLPPVPYLNSTLLERKVRIQKIANQGTVGGGLFANLSVGDFAAFTNGTNGPFRIKQITSWTIPRYNSGASGAEYSSVNVPLQSGSSGTEVMPTWANNLTRIGSGFSGLVTKFPLGDLPLFTANETLNVIQHYVADGFVGGSATDFLSVVFDVIIEVLI